MSNNFVLGDAPFVKALQKWGLIAFAVGAAGSAGTFAVGGFESFIANYLIGFVYFMGIGITMLFFATLMYLANAGWASAVRRVAELLSGFVVYLPLFVIPIIAGMGTLYHWMHAPADDHILQHKGPFLNQTFFIIRIAVYLGLWFLMRSFIVGNSLKQDTATDTEPSKKNWKRAAPFILVYGLTITFISFDLIMSLEPHWFSTIFGVYSFAGHFGATLSTLFLVLRFLDTQGYLKGYIRTEHYHDIGKLMFGFTVFWAYVAFSQYFIVWYGNMPEETFFYLKRLNNGWSFFGWGSLIVHFVAPFLFMIRQDIKRKPQMLTYGAILLLTGHLLDLCWIVLPVFGAHHGEVSHFNPANFWQTISLWLLFLGAFLYIASLQFKKHPFIAYNDPYLHESLEYHSGSYDRA